MEQLLIWLADNAHWDERNVVTKKLRPIFIKKLVTLYKFFNINSRLVKINRCRCIDFKCRRYYLSKYDQFDIYEAFTPYMVKTETGWGYKSCRAF